MLLKFLVVVLVTVTLVLAKLSLALVTVTLVLAKLPSKHLKPLLEQVVISEIRWAMYLVYHLHS